MRLEFLFLIQVLLLHLRHTLNPEPPYIPSHPRRPNILTRFNATAFLESPLSLVPLNPSPWKRLCFLPTCALLTGEAVLQNDQSGPGMKLVGGSKQAPTHPPSKTISMVI